jgi:hypothetical protein
MVLVIDDGMTIRRKQHGAADVMHGAPSVRPVNDFQMVAHRVRSTGICRQQKSGPSPLPFVPKTCAPPVHSWSAHHRSGQIPLISGGTSRSYLDGRSAPATLRLAGIWGSIAASARPLQRFCQMLLATWRVRLRGTTLRNIIVPAIRR